MSHLRAILRLGPIALITGTVYALWLLSRPVSWIIPGFGIRAHNFLTRNWARGILFVQGVHVEVRGTPPKAPFFLVANHLSYLDIVVLFSAVDGYFVAKSEVARWPIMGFLARTTGTLFIDRARKSDLNRAMKLIEGVLRSGSGIIIFPEGTSTKGESVWPFKPSMFQSAMRENMPVSVASLHYATQPPSRPAHEVVCWWGDMTFADHAWELIGLPRVDARVTFGSERIVEEDRKTLALRAHEAVESLFTPVVTN